MSIITENAVCLLTGLNFSPKNLSKDIKIQFYKKHERDEIDKRNGKKWKHGGAIINKASHINKKGDDIKLSDLLNFLIKNKKYLGESGVEDIDVTLILAYDSDMSAWHIEYEDLKKLVELEVGLSLDIYESSEEDHDQE